MDIIYKFAVTAGHNNEKACCSTQGSKPLKYAMKRPIYMIQ